MNGGSSNRYIHFPKCESGWDTFQERRKISTPSTYISFPTIVNNNISSVSCNAIAIVLTKRIWIGSLKRRFEVNNGSFVLLDVSEILHKFNCEDFIFVPQSLMFDVRLSGDLTRTILIILTNTESSQAYR